MKNTFEEKRQAKIERLRERSRDCFKASREKADSQNIKTLRGLMGEPVKIGHHSEHRHRRLIKNADNDMRSSVNLHKQAEEYARRAEAAEKNNAIFSDDPHAIEKLTEKITVLEKEQERMKKLNAMYRKSKGNIDKMDISKELKCKMKDMKLRASMPDHYRPFPSFYLTNNNQNINRLKKRLARLIKASEDESSEIVINGIRIIDNVEANRVQIFFDKKPDVDTINSLKSSGFRWARSIGSWQRHRSNQAMYRAKAIAEAYQVSA